MAISKSTDESTRTGVYHVKESGLEYQHIKSESTPKDGKEYLERFRYVDTKRVMGSNTSFQSQKRTLSRKIFLQDKIQSHFFLSS